MIARLLVLIAVSILGLCISHANESPSLEAAQRNLRRTVLPEIATSLGAAGHAPRTPAEESSTANPLDRCPISIRTKFLQSIVLVDGRLASGDFSVLRNCSSPDIESAADKFFAITAVYRQKTCVLGFCDYHPTAKCTSNCGKLPTSAPEPDGRNITRGYVSLQTLTANCPETAKNEFLTRLQFVRGRLTEPPASLLKQCEKQAAIPR